MERIHDGLFYVGKKFLFSDYEPPVVNTVNRFQFNFAIGEGRSLPQGSSPSVPSAGQFSISDGVFQF